MILMLGWMMSMCTNEPMSAADASDGVDAGSGTDSGHPADSGHGYDAFMADAATVDAYADDAYIDPPCSPGTSGMPGQLICTGIRYTGDRDMTDASAVVIDGSVTADTGVFLDNGDVYVEVPLLLAGNCFGMGMPAVPSAPRTGSFMIEVTVEGAVTPMTIDITDLALDDFVAGDETLIWLNSMHDMLSSSADPDLLALADDLTLASMGVMSALTTPQPILGGWDSGCIPAYSCCAGSAVMDRYGITVIDAYLRNVRHSILDMTPHTLDDGPLPPSMEVCTANWRSAALCSLGFAGLAALKAGEGDWGNAGRAALGTAYCALTALGIVEHTVLDGAPGVPRWASTQISHGYNTIKSTVESVISLGFNTGVNEASAAVRRFWRRAVDDATVDCSACAVQQSGSCADGCIATDPTMCGCGASQLACTSYASYYCTPYCTGECIDRLCTYAGSVLEDDDGSPHGCPSRCSGMACPSIGF